MLDYIEEVQNLLSAIFVKDEFGILDAIENIEKLVHNKTEISKEDSDVASELYDVSVEIVDELKEDDNNYL